MKKILVTLALLTASAFAQNDNQNMTLMLSFFNIQQEGLTVVNCPAELPQRLSFCGELPADVDFDSMLESFTFTANVLSGTVSVEDPNELGDGSVLYSAVASVPRSSNILMMFIERNSGDGFVFVGVLSR